MILNERLKKLRAVKNVTQQRVADELGVTVGNVQKFEYGTARPKLDNVIKIVPDPGYLKEARNLAAYHHEKGDGSGYPEGRAGSDIPLSARIMAVADVFDALVSKRSYKDGFPFEKALAIMREGFGTHFDPQVLQAFVRFSQRVKQAVCNLPEPGNMRAHDREKR